LNQLKGIKEVLQTSYKELLEWLLVVVGYFFFTFIRLSYGLK
jgi:hypothetical protein